MTKSRNKRRRQQPSRQLLTLRYDAVAPNLNTRPAYLSSRPEDAELTPNQRQLLLSVARDQIRNFTMAGFVLRKHLQSVAFYRFIAKTPDTTLNAELTRRVERWKHRNNCDCSGRFSFDQLCYLWESHRALDGDVGIVKLSNGKLQIIEGDRIRTPNEILSNPPDDKTYWTHGVKINEYGQPLAYAISRRKPEGGYIHERTIPARNMYLLGYYQRRDQTRGIPLSAPAIKQFAYLYESIDLALAKQKLEQVLGLKTQLRDDRTFTRGRESQSNEERNSQIDNELIETFGPGIMHLRLYDGETAELFTSNNPSSNFQMFCEKVLQLIFAAYDIPYSFYDGSKTNFYGSRGEFEQYMDSVETKQVQTCEMLSEMFWSWLVPIWMVEENDPLVLPDGYTPERLAEYCRWCGAGMPQWRLYEYVKDIGAAANLGLVSLSETASQYGSDAVDNIKDNATLAGVANKYAMPLALGVGSTNIGM